jgi:hypothetical protein
MYSTLSAISSRVEHPAMAHRDPVVDGDRVELARDPPGGVDRLGDDLTDRPQMCMAGHELRVGVGDRDDRLAEILACDAGGAQQGARTGHVASARDGVGPELWHYLRLPTSRRYRPSRLVPPITSVLAV